MSLSTSPSPRHLSASGSRSPQANISNINKVERLVGKRGQDYLKENLQKSRITTMRTHLLQAKIPVRPPSIGPAIVMLDMLGVPPHEVNQILIKELCEDIKSDLSNMNQDNLILCLTKRIFKTGYYELMDNDEFQAVTLEVINRIQPKNISQELAGLLKNLWDKGNPKNEKNPMPFLREMFMKISLSTRQKIYHWHKVLLQEQVDQHFQTYCIESVNAIRDNAHWDLNYFQSAVKLAESLFVARNADTLDESRKLFRIVSDYLRLKYFETGNVYYGEYRIYLLMNLRKLDFPFKVKPAGENLLKALNGLNDLSNNNTNNRKVLEQSLIKINDELISALNVVKLPIERINRLTDKRTISDLILTYKLQAPRRRKQPGYKSLAGGTLTLNRGLWVYKCREYKDQAKGEQIKNIVQNLKHTYHQERIRNTIGTSLNVLLLTPEIMVRCNRVWFEWCERNKISKGTKLEDNSILHVPTDEIITREMVPRGILQDFDSLMTRIHKEILERYIMMNKSVAKRFTGKDVFEKPVVPNYVPTPEERTAFRNKHSVGMTDAKYKEYVHMEQKNYFEIIGGNQMCVEEILKNINSKDDSNNGMKVNKYEDKPASIFLTDVNLMFDNCIKYHTWLLENRKDRTGPEKEFSKNLIGYANRLKINCYNRFLEELKKYEQYRESAEIERKFLKIHEDDELFKDKMQKEYARKRIEERKSKSKSRGRGRPRTISKSQSKPAISTSSTSPIISTAGGSSNSNPVSNKMKTATAEVPTTTISQDTRQ